MLYYILSAQDSTSCYLSVGNKKNLIKTIQNENNRISKEIIKFVTAVTAKTVLCTKTKQKLTAQYQTIGNKNKKIPKTLLNPKQTKEKG
ncbi:hypothetical protein O0S10_08475 [Methanocorpusculum sp. MG]|uniref:Uncharacterized protein n=1 Tax=Methanocorpusculum petauri TaxID=3002863 RepID=A0ABT4IJ23_9EURY|nr:hypothetical protein [Methanocorpusculum petauri]MCZ0861252.1 hypothetical protein [Methanocorpusculum petauri]